jgi:hypothetical protein
MAGNEIRISECNLVLGGMLAGAFDTFEPATSHQGFTGILNSAGCDAEHFGGVSG